MTVVLPAHKQKPRLGDPLVTCRPAQPNVGVLNLDGMNLLHL